MKNSITKKEKCSLKAVTTFHRKSQGKVWLRFSSTENCEIGTA